MNIYEFIDSQKDDTFIKELIKYLCEKYNIQGNSNYFKTDVGFDSYLNKYEIAIGEYIICMYADSLITIGDVKHINGISIKTIQNEIGCFLKYYKRKKIIDELH